jgi:Bardet-Biedl syndrome 4 protein
MAKKFGIEKLMIAANDLSHFAMATTTTTTAIVPPSIVKPTVNPKWPSENSTIEKYNWLLHIMYGRGDYDRTQQFIRLQSYKSAYMTYVQALIYREEGRINEALEYFQICFRENPCVINIKQVGKSLALLGRYRLAIDAYKEALTHTTNDWEILHNLGLCYLNLNELSEAKKYFLQALQISEFQEASYLSLAKVLIREGNREEAEAIYERGSRRNPESPELFTQIGLMAFEVLFSIKTKLFHLFFFLESKLYKSI